MKKHAVRDKPPPIVGIGASAGGLEAFQQLLKALPANTGMAFVLVQHLAPGHESILTKLLSNATSMPVTEVKNGMAVEPNHVYVIPPNASMEVVKGLLHLSARAESGSKHLPIDHFLQSLALDQGSRAIGVILSGAASDGTLGLQAIKEEGGITFAQDEKSARYDGMPRSAVAGGCVDFVLPPGEMASELARIGRFSHLGRPPGEEVVRPLTQDGDLHRILIHLRHSAGVDFTHYKQSTVERRIVRRMVLNKIGKLSQYLKYLRENRAESEALFEDILIRVTGFFRDPDVFQALKDVGLPMIFRDKPSGEPIRIWVPGCSSGEEAYSIAIVLLEHLNERSVPIQIFGTDISEGAIDRARAGIYPESSVAEVSKDRLRRFFVKVDGGYQIAKTLRELCVFARQDLTRDPPFSRLDLISCRNVLIYMDQSLQTKAMAIFHYALRPSGALLLGKSESISGFSSLFLPVGGKHKLYSKTAAESPAVFRTAPAVDTHGVELAAGAPLRKFEPPGKFDVRKEADRLVLDRYGPAGLVVNDQLNIVQFRGNAAAFLSPSAGEASLEILRMVRPEFALELRAAINRARKEDGPVRKDGIPVRRNGHHFEVSLEVVPIKEASGHAAEGQKHLAGPYFLVLFHEARISDPAAARESLSANKISRAREAEIAQLRREVQTTKEYLQSIIEGQEATNEELQSANEEIQSSNEELQSTNEELETAQEELQSTNEELITVNEQLQNRNAELALLSDDLTNLLTGVNIPILMLGGDLRIRRFTPLAEHLLNLLPADMGRPIDSFRPNLEILPDGGGKTTLAASIKEVIDTATVQEREVQDLEGHWYSMRVRPYRTTEGKLDGALVTFIDIHALKATQIAVEELNSFSTAVMESAGALVMVTDAEGRIVRFNRACEELTGYKISGVQGKYLWDDLLTPAVEAAQVKAIHKKVLRRLSTAEHEGNLLSRAGEQRLIAWSSAAFPGGRGAPAHIVHTGRDITVERGAETALRSADAQLRKTQEQLRTLTAGLLRTQEDERRRISRELHDDISQKLAALTVEAETLARRAQVPGGVSRIKLHAFRDRLAAVSEDLRRTAHQLHPSSLEQLGLAPALKSYCADVARQEGIAVQFRTQNSRAKVPPEMALNLYRVVQEALRNVVKHSGARRATVSLSTSGDDVHLTVRDRGRGFDPGRKRTRGLGLINMDERVRLLQGRFSLRTKPGEGVRIDVRVPLPGKRERPG